MSQAARVPHRAHGQPQPPQQGQQGQQPSAVPSRSLSTTVPSAAAALAAVPEAKVSTEAAAGQGVRERVRRVSVSDMMAGGIMAGLTSLS